MVSMRFRGLIAVVLLCVACAAPASAQQSVKLEFKDGRVSLNAQNAPLRAILSEWARLGGSIIVNGDRVSGAPVTLELVAVPERQALDTLLRSVAAYMLAPRRAGSIGASTFDRILILPTSAAPRNPPPPANAALAAPRPLVPRPQPIVSPNIPTEAPDANDADTIPPADLVPQPRVVRPPQPLPGNGITVPTPVAEPDGAATEPVIVGGTAPTPGNPFGIPAGSSARPGVISPVPQQPAPNPNQPSQP
jgi:hypothetical protein